MELKPLVQYTDEKGKPFTLLADMDHFKKEIQEYLDTDLEGGDEDYSLGCCQMEYDRPPTLEERQLDNSKMAEFLNWTEEDWRMQLNNAARKKNGTLAKGRVLTLATFPSYGHYWEDSYGFNTPQIRIKNFSDDTAVLDFGTYIIKD